MIKRYQRTSISQYLVVGIVFLALVGASFFAFFIMKNIPFVDHFAIPWAAGRSWLIDSQNPYGTSISTTAKEAIDESGFLGLLPDQQNLIHPIINLIFFLPFSLFPYVISRVLWVVILTVCNIFACYYALKLSRWKIAPVEKIILLIFSLVFLPVAFSILSGGLSPVIIMLALLSVYLIENKQDTSAGFLLSLVFGSAQMAFLLLLFIIIWSISHRRWAIVGSFLAGVAFLIVVTIMMYPSWPMDWLRIMAINYMNFEWVKTPLMQLAIVLPGIESFLSIALHGLLGFYLLIILLASARSNENEIFWYFCSICAITILFQMTSDASILLLIFPGMFLVLRYWITRRGSLGSVISWTSLGLLAVTPWIVFPHNQYFTQQDHLLFLMIILPMVILFSSVGARWWSKKMPELPYTK